MWLWSTIARSPTDPPASPAASASRMTDRDEVQGPFEACGLQREITGRDRRDETVIERLGDPQCRVDTIPAGADRELVRAQLACVKEAEHLDAGKAWLEQLAVLLDGVLAQMPGV